MAAVPIFIAIPGVNVFFWSFIGFLRFLQEEVISPQQITRPERELSFWMEKNVVAVCIAARNEEHGIARTLRSLKGRVGVKNIFVASDQSTDKTAKIARSFGVHVVELEPNRGKANALSHLIDHYNLLSEYTFILFVDADTHINHNYLRQALPFFADPQIVAVAGHGKTEWKKHFWPKWRMFFIAYRDRLYNLLQFTIRYGQTTRWANVSPIIPGFASIYRTSALSKIDIKTSGLAIEDFNMTFQIHHKKLGKIAYHPKVFGIARDPTNFKDYVRQVERWNLGFWQTVIKYGFRLDFFSLATFFYVIESLFTAFFFYLLPVIMFILTFKFLPQYFSPSLVGLSLTLSSYIDFIGIFFIFFLFDYFLTFIVFIIGRRPKLLLYGLGFPFLRIVDAILIISTLPKAVFTKSKGSWVPAERR